MKEKIQQTLIQYLESLIPSKLKEAALYAVKAGGKRLRPQIVLSVIDSYGIDYQPYLSVAASLEMIHIYSLIHDDLPAMDDDALRHGMPTLHRQFDEGTAILVGDGFLTNAFHLLTQNVNLNDLLKIRLVELLSANAGFSGMIYGQHLDLEFEKKSADIETLKTISLHKTGQLLEAAFRMGALIAEPRAEGQWAKVGKHLGLLFQIQDDVLEATVSEAQLQKSKSDVLLGKATFVSQLGLAKAQQLIQDLRQEINQIVIDLPLKKPTIIDLINTIYDRRY